LFNDDKVYIKSLNCDSRVFFLISC